MTAFFEDHLGLDAVVAFVDGELGLVAYQRAAAHLSRCEACSAEVAEQSAARQRLRAAGGPAMPSSLFETLRAIPVVIPDAPPAPGLDRDPLTGHAWRTGTDSPDGRGFHPGRGRGFRLGASAIVAGIAVGALAAAAVAEHENHPANPASGHENAKVAFAGTAAPAVGVVSRGGR